MKRSILAMTCGLLVAAFAVGCGGGGGEGDSARREPPKEKVPAPGASLNSPDSDEGEPPEEP